MEFTVTKKYLELPISTYAQSKNVRLYENGVLKDDFNTRLDFSSPMYTAYYDLSGYMGKRLTIDTFPKSRIEVKQTDFPDFRQYEGYPLRPIMHFSPKFGWLNDPNGLLEYTSPVTGQKTYHMFFQFNPYDTVWGNMHWGHAISSDLVSWEQIDIALYPDENGTIYSGGGYVDKCNHSGLKMGNEYPILLYYTCAGSTSTLSQGKKFTQCLAYSTDGGKTFEKYAKNPLIDHIESENRDPKVVWCSELDCYIMAFYLEDFRFSIYTSKNLLDWSHLQDIELKGDRECPDLFPLPVNGNKDNVKWILMGASQMYAVLEIQDGRFSIIQEPQMLEYQPNSYAPQSFANVSDGRIVAVAWVRNTTLPHGPFTSHMSIPFERTLREKNGKYFLCSNPVAELDNCIASSKDYADITVTEDKPFEEILENSPYDFEFEFDSHSGETVYISLLGSTLEINPAKNEASIYSGSGAYARNNQIPMPLSLTGTKCSLRIITDKDCFEMITDQGSAVMTYAAICDQGSNTLTIQAKNPTTLKNIKVKRYKL